MRFNFQNNILLLAVLLILGVSCKKETKVDNYQNIFKQLNAKTSLIELIGNDGNARLMIAPELQGRIITTATNGINGPYNAWLDKKKLADDSKWKEGIGGEDRIWIGPLGGQFSFYYQQIEPISDDNWLVPKTMNAEPFQLMSQNEKMVQLQKEMKLTNFVGTNFRIQVDRTLTLLNKTAIQENLNLDFSDQIKFVAFESQNTITNLDDSPHKKETGLVAVWSAGMIEGTDETTVIIPLKENSSEPIFKYMGKLDENRLQIKEDVLFFKADGKYRSKIGIPPSMAPSIYGCYAKDKKRLSIVQYQQNTDELYFNSEVTIQENPYRGEVIPIYNNGPMDFSTPKEASFFELESTSPMRELLPNESIEHFHRVYHFEGEEEELNRISQQLLHTNLEKLF